MTLRKNSLQTGGKTSFYGVHRHVRANLSPKTGIKAPINDLCGPHVTINSTVPFDAHIRSGEEKHDRDSQPWRIVSLKILRDIE